MPRRYRRRRSACRRRRTGGFNWGSFASGLLSTLPTLANVGKGVYEAYKQGKTSGMYGRRRPGPPRRRTGGPPRRGPPRYRRRTHGLGDMITRRQG